MVGEPAIEISWQCFGEVAGHLLEWQFIFLGSTWDAILCFELSWQKLAKISMNKAWEAVYQIPPLPRRP